MITADILSIGGSEWNAQHSLDSYSEPSHFMLPAVDNVSTACAAKHWYIFTSMDLTTISSF